MTDPVADPARDPGTVAAAAPPGVAAIFGDRAELAQRYRALLAGPGLERGLIGPREVPRLWERHLVNCALIGELFPAGARVVDVGSGAGLPGLALAIVRPDLRLDLVESLARRSEFLREAVDVLGLGAQVRVVRGRAEDAAVRAQVGEVDWVTARAVAPLDRLVAWCLPLLRSGGTIVAMKGAQAQAEISASSEAIRRAGGSIPVVRECGVGRWPEPTTVVLVTRQASVAAKGRR